VPDMKKAWVVYGESGEYSDYTMWIVRAFSNEGAAITFLAALEENREGLCAEGTHCFYIPSYSVQEVPLDFLDKIT
jgi:hypothetical protein